MHNQSQQLLLYQNSVFNKDLSMSEFIVPASASVLIPVSLCQGHGVRLPQPTSFRFSRSTREDVVSAVGPDLIK